MKKVIVLLSAVVLLIGGFVALPINSFGSDTTVTIIDTPKEISYITDIKSMPTGELVLIGGNQFDKTLTKYVSVNEGDTWQKECEYLQKLPIDMSEAEAVDAYGHISEDGYVAISVVTYDKYLQNVNADNEDELGAELYAYIIASDGGITEVEQPITEEYGGFHKAYFAGKKMYFDDIRGNLYEVDRNSGALLGRVMESTDFLSAVGVAEGDVLSVVTQAALGYPVGKPFPKSADTEAYGASGDWQVYQFIADAVDGENDTYYIADMDGISIYSKEAGKKLVHKNNLSNVNEYSHFYDMTVIDDDTVVVSVWNEKTDTGQLIKYQLQR